MMEGIGEMAMFVVALLLVVVVGVPFIGSFLYFVLQRMRTNDEEGRRRNVEQRRAFKRFAGRAAIVFFGLFLFSFCAKYLLLQAQGYVSVWTVGVLGFDSVDLTLYPTLALGAAYAGCVFAGVPLPGAKRKA